MVDKTIFQDIKNRSESILSYYHIFAYAATSRKEYRQGKYEGYDFALLIFTVIACIEDLHINQKECTKKAIIEQIRPILIEQGVTDISPEDLVNEVITNCLENNGIIIKKDTFMEDVSPSVSLIQSKHMNYGDSYVSTYDLTTMSLNLLYSTKEFFDIVSQSNIIIKKQLKRGNVGEAIREAKALRSTISVELDEVEKMISNIRNNIYNLDAIKMNERMKDLLDDIMDHQKETQIIIQSIDKEPDGHEYLTQKDRVSIKHILNEVSKMQLKLLTNIQDCIKLLDDNILNFDFITNHNTIRIYEDIIAPIEKDKQGEIKLDRLFAPLFALPLNKMFDINQIFEPQQVVSDKIMDIHYIEDDVEVDEIPEIETHTQIMVSDCTELFYLLLDDLSQHDTIMMNEFIDRHDEAKDKLSAVRLLSLYLFTAMENGEIKVDGSNLIDGDYQTSIHIEKTDRNTFSVMNEFFLYPNRIEFRGNYIEISPLEETLEYQNEHVLIRIPNMRFGKRKKEKGKETL